MNHITLARQLFIKHNVRERGLASSRMEMMRMGLNGQDINKVVQVLKGLLCQ